MKRIFSMTYSEAGKILGISKQRVHQLLNEIEGRCMTCGKECSPESAVFCSTHIEYQRKRNGYKGRNYNPIRKTHSDKNIKLRVELIKLLTNK
jgi:hypothetical protein